MNRTRIIVISAVAIFLLGGMIISWAVYQRGDTVETENCLKSFTDENFQEAVVKASMKHPVLVDFYADWCFPCRMLEPVIDEVATELCGQAVVGKLNTDKNLISRRFGISRLPALFVIKDGEIKRAIYGVVPKETIVDALNEHGS